jgi:hypothetical protein
MSNDILDDQPVLGSIIISSKSNSGTLKADGFPGTIGEPSALVSENQRLRNALTSRMSRETMPPCSCPTPIPSLSRGFPVCRRCGGRVAA